MNFVRGLFTGIFCTLAGFAAVWATWWVVHAEETHSKPTKSHPSPATVDKTLSEDKVNLITLTPEAVARLALQTGVVEERPMPRMRTYPGEVIVPPGRTALVAAPISGSLQAVGEPLEPGQRVNQGKTIFHLLPLLTPEGRANLTATHIEAEGLIKTAETQVQAAQVALQRARRVLQGEAGSQRTVDEAQAQYDLAQKSLEAATARHKVLSKIVGDAESGRAGPLAIESPATGMLRNMLAFPGQDVSAGAPLFEVVDLSRLWVRASIYAGDVASLDAISKVAVTELSAKPDAATHSASPVAAPPSANALAATIDLYYEIEPPLAAFRPGQRLNVSVPLRSEAKSLVVPWSAVLYDIYGGAWVYVQKGERSFDRERVVVRHVVDQKAVLANGPPAGTKVVVAGAAELFGTETGFSK